MQGFRIKTKGKIRYCQREECKRKRRAITDRNNKLIRKSAYKDVLVLVDNKKRRCLKCGKLFKSKSNENRICERCKRINGYVYTSEDWGVGCVL